MRFKCDKNGQPVPSVGNSDAVRYRKEAKKLARLSDHEDDPIVKAAAKAEDALNSLAAAIETSVLAKDKAPATSGAETEEAVQPPAAEAATA